MLQLWICQSLTLTTIIGRNSQQNKLITSWELWIRIDKSVIIQILNDLNDHPLWDILNKLSWFFHFCFVSYKLVNRLTQNVKTLTNICLLTTNFLTNILYCIIRKCPIDLFRSLTQNLSNLSSCVLWKNQTFVTKSWCYF